MSWELNKQYQRAEPKAAFQVYNVGGSNLGLTEKKGLVLVL